MRERVGVYMRNMGMFVWVKRRTSWKSNDPKGEQRELASETGKPNSPSSGFKVGGSRETRNLVPRWRPSCQELPRLRVSGRSIESRLRNKVKF